MVNNLYKTLLWVAFITTAFISAPATAQVAEINAKYEADLIVCEEVYRARVNELRAVVDQGSIKDRAALIEIVENMGRPKGSVDTATDTELLQAAASLVGTNKAKCESTAHAASAADLQSLRDILAANMVIIREETAMLQDYLNILGQQERMAKGNAPIQLQIAKLKRDLGALVAQTAARAAQNDAL